MEQPKVSGKQSIPEELRNPGFDKPFSEMDADIVELMSMFFEHRLETLRTGLKRAREAGKLVGLERAAHNLKGSAETYQASCLTAPAVALHDHCEAGRLAEAIELAEIIETAVLDLQAQAATATGAA